MRCIIFDLDDTLYPYEHFRISGFGAVARHVEGRDGVSALRAFSALCRARLSRPGCEFQALAEDLRLPPARVDEWTTVFRNHTPDLALTPSVRAMLAGLRANGWRIGILTNGAPATQRRKLAALDVIPLVDAHVCAEDVMPGGKPAVACFDAVLAALGTTARATVHAGDDLLADVHGAAAAGLRTVRVRSVSYPGSCPGDADLVVNRVEEVAYAAAHLIPEDLAHVA